MLMAMRATELDRTIWNQVTIGAVQSGVGTRIDRKGVIECRTHPSTRAVTSHAARSEA